MSALCQHLNLCLLSYLQLYVNGYAAYGQERTCTTKGTYASPRKASCRGLETTDTLCGSKSTMTPAVREAGGRILCLQTVPAPCLAVDKSV